MQPVSSHRDIALRLLLLCDSPALIDALRSSWQWEGPTPEFSAVSGLPALRSALRSGSWDAVLHCLNHAGCTPVAALRTLRDRGLETPLIVVAEPADQRTAMKALRCGIHDIVFTDRLERLPAAVEREVREAGQRADHRAALEMLHDSETRFRALASNLPGLVFNLQRDPAGRFRFLYVSEGSTRLLGIAPHELRGITERFFACLLPADQQTLIAALEESAQSGNPLSWEGRLRDGVRWIDMRSLPHRGDEGTVQWTGIATDITRTKNTEAALRESRAQLAALSFHLEAAKEEERERIARDIHDELGSILVRLKIEAALLASKLPVELADKARSIENLLDQAMSTASRVARQLRPGILKEFGLAAAIECQAEDFMHSTGITCRAQCDDGIEVDPETSLALFRITQEALTNIAKHAHASLVAVRLRRENGNIVLEIRDNGRGIAECDLDKPKSFGLRGIRERVQSLDGSFHIASAEQGGTLLILKVPERHGDVVAAGEAEPVIQPDLF
ncbi:hybrid sensor histidine kinase/response regulator [Sulfuricystis multivorans]|uniref:hybrid sensor histidine kinase/response regulator n=1 Tax=Sulfuricystis multivorans TaxID=2211108 RepID=UPI000F8253C6|nr:ATP-binding protein [Sulfuricystis multivorans]